MRYREYSYSTIDGRIVNKKFVFFSITSYDRKLNENKPLFFLSRDVVEILVKERICCHRAYCSIFTMKFIRNFPCGIFSVHPQKKTSEEKQTKLRLWRTSARSSLENTYLRKIKSSRSSGRRSWLAGKYSKCPPPEKKPIETLASLAETLAWGSTGRDGFNLEMSWKCSYQQRLTLVCAVSAWVEGKRERPELFWAQRSIRNELFGEQRSSLVKVRPIFGFWKVWKYNFLSSSIRLFK